MSDVSRKARSVKKRDRVRSDAPGEIMAGKPLIRNDAFFQAFSRRSLFIEERLFRFEKSLPTGFVTFVPVRFPVGEPVQGGEAYRGDVGIGETLEYETESLPIFFANVFWRFEIVFIQGYRDRKETDDVYPFSGRTF